MSNQRYTWMNGVIVPWQDSKIHINTDAVLRGASIFEGIRAYRTASGGDLRLFRATDHLRRMLNTSARVLHLDLAYTVDDLRAAIIELLRANDLHEHAHIRVVAYFDEPELGDGPDTTGAFILAFPRPHSPRLKPGSDRPSAYGAAPVIWRYHHESRPAAAISTAGWRSPTPNTKALTYQSC
jgi:branched-chain amino acid aminotransferase